MKWQALLLILPIGFSALAANKPKDHHQLMSALKKYETSGDDLGARVVIKKIAHAGPTYLEWAQVRQTLMRRPSIGYGLLYKWETVPFRGKRSDPAIKSEEKMNHWLATADSLMSAGKFQQAFGYYQSAARVLKKQASPKHTENHLLQQVVFQSMGRALYGARRFEDALTVYGWIDRNYPHYRQVLFEKMWTAFRGDHADIALGQIAAQQSTYFSDEMEPESYLIQLYIYKKLCRVEEQKQIREEIGHFRKRLQTGSYTYADWAKSDIETYGLLRLAEKPTPTDSDDIVSAHERQHEQRIIKDSLIKKFASEKKRLSTELSQVLAYSYLATGSNLLKLKQEDLERSKLRKEGSEIWPVSDAEDWLDEIGSQIYIGASQCPQK